MQNTSNQLFYESFKEMTYDDIMVLARYFNFSHDIHPEIARVLLTIIQTDHLHDSNLNMYLPIYQENRKLEIDVSTKRCFEGRGYDLLKEISIGQYSTIFHGKKRDKSGKLTKNITFKIILLTDTSSGIHSQQHFDSLKHKLSTLNKHGIGPSILSSWICLPRSTQSKQGSFKIGIIVMDQWDGDLSTISRKLLTSIPKSVLDDLYAQMVTIHQLGLVHGDAVLSNILFKQNTDGILSKLTFTDFDFTGNDNDVPKEQIENVLSDNIVSNFLISNNIPIQTSLPLSLIDFSVLGYLYNINKYSIPESLELIITPHQKTNMKSGYKELGSIKKTRKNPCPSKKQCSIM
jgi:hypothetical protein